MEKRRRKELIMKSIISLLILIVVVLAVILVKDAVVPEVSQRLSQWKEQNQVKGSQAQGTGSAGGEQQDGEDMSGASGTASADGQSGIGSASVSVTDDSISELIASADLLAAQYDYDAAITLLQTSDAYTGSQEMQEAAARYQQTKESCVSYPIDQITHVFFHTMIKDTSKAFDGDEDEGGYNQVMTTMSEFAAIMETMYEKGYVMVSLHDICTVNEDGTVSRGEIRLPAGKIPFVLSQDDVSYYHYMDGDGFAQKLIVDENGDIKNTYIEDDGSISVGDYDMVPWIDTFVKEHPDFSYHGHKGVLALTGYEGVLGYRTDEVYRTKDASRVTKYQQEFFDSNPDFDEAAWQEEVDQATAVAEAMKAEGWEFASHTWGHISPQDRGLEVTQTDTERWQQNVASIVGDTDIIIFAFGADIGDWQPYTEDNEFFTYFRSQGFHIFCNVDSSQNWVQFGNTFMRQGRRNLDGYRMYYNPDMLSDLFHVDDVWDSSRPTPVPEM
jgi:hypothetical protein